MSFNLPSLNWILAFEAASRTLSFTAAAKELNRTQTSVSHQVRSLEKYLGFQLFERQAHGLQLTDMGLAYMPSVRRALEDLSVSTAGLFGGGEGKPVTVRAPVSLAVLWLSPRLKDFALTHPQIDIRLCSALWADALAPEETDIDIRLGNGNWPDYDSELLLHEAAIPICAPETRRALGKEPGIAEFRHFPLIHIVGFEDLWMRAFHAAGIDDYNPSRRGITVDTSLSAIEIAASGHGFALVLESLARKPLQEGRLCQAADIRVPIDHHHFILTPTAKGRIRPDVLILKEWLMQHIAGS